MFRHTTASIVALACLLVLAFTSRDNRAAAADDATSKPSTQPAGEVIDVKDHTKLKEMIGTTVTVRGKVREVFVPQSGAVSIFNFEGIDRRAFNVVVPKADLEAVNAGFDGDVAKAVKDQTVTVTGAIADYRGNPQIQLTTPEQLKVEKKE